MRERLLSRERPKTVLGRKRQVLYDSPANPLFLNRTSSVPATEYRVELENFHGPLDLLLYLVRKHELDTADIPIAQITEPSQARPATGPRGRKWL